MEELSFDKKEIEKRLKPYHRVLNCSNRIQTVSCLIIGFGMIGGMIIGIAEPNIPESVMNAFLAVFGVAIVAYFVFKILSWVLHGKYAEEYRNIFLPLLNTVLTDVTYNHKGGYTKEEFKQIGIAAWKSSYSFYSEDLIEGLCEGVPFKQADIRIEDTDSKVGLVNVNGVLREFTYPLARAGEVLIVKSGANLDMDWSQNWNKVQMEAVQFNDSFDVYAKDELGAFYLLTPHFMEYVKSLEEMDYDLYIYFTGEKLYFLQHGKGGLFTPPEIESFDVDKEIQKVKEQLSEVSRLIDVLKITANA